jgi:hypothetical protein
MSSSSRVREEGRHRAALSFTKQRLVTEPEGITAAVLRLVVPVGQERFEKGMWRLQESGRIQSHSEVVPDRALRMRRQTVWQISG